MSLLPIGVFATEDLTEAGDEECSTKATTKAATVYASQITSLATPYNVAYAVPSNSYATSFDGKAYYYIVHTSSATAGHLLSLAKEVTEQYAASTNVKISGNSLTNPDPNQAVRIELHATNAARGYLQPYNGYSLNVNGIENQTYVKMSVGNASQFGGRATNGKYVFLSFQSAGSVTGDGDPWFSLQYTSNGFTIGYHGLDHTVYSDTETMQLYRVYTQGIELYKAIKAVAGYADGNADGRFDSTYYNTFNTYLGECITYYNANNNVTDNEAGLKADMDARAAQLLKYATELDAHMTDMSAYIDIPVEILDFRADGMLLEWERGTNYHPKWNFRSDTGKTGAIPKSTTLGSKGTVYTGLTQSTLVKGQMVYTEKVVAYVAGFLKDKYATDWSQNTKIPGYNKIPFQKMNSLTSDGSFSDTIGKTDTMENGGYLNWNQVTTRFDMAYYILNNLWRPVESTDYMDTTNKLGYNMVVPERKRLRLFYDEATKLYTIDASKRMSYNGYYAYNGSEPAPTDAKYLDAFFRPIDGLGFETAANKELVGGDTDQGAYLTRYGYDSQDTNFHFSMHAKGSFVYYRNQNLRFEFVGDDDVYFYINGKIALDLGSSHTALGDTVFLNSIAESHGLEEGGVYSFDMFYIERHASASNLKFSTNINIVETETMTTKGMYAEKESGSSLVDANGFGKPLSDNALMRDGDIVAYSFNIANSRDIPVYNVSFSDPSLGTTLSPSAVTLCSTALTGGINTSVSDVEFYYRTIDDSNVIYSGNPAKKSVAEITSLINTANSAKTGLNAGAYRVSPGSATDIKNLLKLGIPENCQLIVYGFKRKAEEAVPLYTNTLSSLCYYNLAGTAQTTSGVEEIPVTGSASRVYQVTADPPSANKVQMVLDYGKAVEIDTDLIRSQIVTDSLASADSFAGIVTTGTHEELLTYIASNKLLCASSGKTYTGKNGTFTRTSKGLTYQPTKLLESVETVYLVFNVTVRMGTAVSDYKYMLVELNILPATSVYYETEFSDGVFNSISGTNLFNNNNCFFADFNNKQTDKERYKSTTYNGRNYDTGNWILRSATMSDLKIDASAGTLTAKRLANVTTTDKPYLLYFQAQNMNFNPANAEVLVTRLRLQGFKVASGLKPDVYVDFYGMDGKNIKSYFVGITEAQVTGGEYFVCTIPVDSLPSYEKNVKKIRIHVRNVDNATAGEAGTVTVDYLYVGPKNSVPNGDQLYFDFSNTEADRARYKDPVYGGDNYDLADSWNTLETQWTKPVIDSKAGTLSTSFVGTRDWIWVQTNDNWDEGFHLKYAPGSDHVVQVRVKFENMAITEGATPNFQLLYYHTETRLDGTSAERLCKFTAVNLTDTSCITSGKWTTLTFALKGLDSADHNNLTSLRFQFSKIKSASSSIMGSVTFDYIYVGPKANAPAKDHLYFDFTNSDVDQARYANDPSYVNRNYDTANWTYRSSSFSGIEFDNSQGTLTANLISTTANTSHYIQSSPGVTSGFYLNYIPKEADSLIVRFRTENLVKSGKPYIGSVYYTEVKKDANPDDGKDDEYLSLISNYRFDETAIDTGAWVTATIPILDAVRNSDKITAVRITIGNVKPISGTDAKIVYDYVFLGAESDFEKVRAKTNEVWQTVSDSTASADINQDHHLIYKGGQESVSRLESIGAGPIMRDEYYGVRNGLDNYNKNIPLSFCHRGSFRSSSENCYLSIYDSILLGMDGIEIDLMLTKDNVVVLSHDTTIERVTGQKITISDVNWADIRDYPLEVGNGTGDAQLYTLTAADASILNSLSQYKTHYGEAAVSGGNHYISRFDDVLELVKERGNNTILTLDKVNTKEIFVACYKLLKDHGMLNQAMFKMSADINVVNEWTQAVADFYKIDRKTVKESLLMLAVVGKPDISKLNDLYNDNEVAVSYLKAVESTYGASSAAAYEKVIVEQFLPFAKAKNIDFYPSTIGPGWAGGRDDDETTWIYYLEKLQADGIMVDSPEEFAGFMHYYNGATRSTSELIQAEHFQSFNLDSFQFYMKEAADVNNNKLVNEMHNGDYLVHRNINFTGSEKTLYVTAKGINGGGKIKFYADSMNGSDCFAEIIFGTSEFCVTRSVSLLKAVPKGSHTVYIQVEGNVGTPLISLDSYTFAAQSDDHYLFFDFNNTTADKNRYKKAIYGSSYNFDVKEYWATYASDNSSDQVNKTNFSIDNKNGVAIIKVGNDFEGEKVYCGPKFMTTKTYGVFPYKSEGANAPLKYKPSPNDYLVVRFKLDGVIQEGSTDPLLFMEYHWNNASGTDNIKYEDLKADYTFATGKWQTVTVPLSSTFKNAAEITSLGLRFTGILSPSASSIGTVTIDYIYVGPLQHKDRLLINFNAWENEEGSYSDSVYGGANYTMVKRWATKSGRATAPTITDGCISFNALSSCGVNYQHLMMANAMMRFTPGDDDYCRIRFKVTGAAAVSGKTPSVHIYYSPDLYGTAGCGKSNNSSKSFSFTDVDADGYCTLDIPMSSTCYRDAGIINSLTVMFNNVAPSSPGSYTIDYIYLGPLDDAPQKTDSALFFDFTNTPADQARYSSYTYGSNYNFDLEGEGFWATHATAEGESSNYSNYSIDNVAGTATIIVGDTMEGETSYGPKFQTTNKYGVYPWGGRGTYAPLHFSTGDVDYLQVRFKIDGCKDAGTNKLQLDYHYISSAGTDAMKYAGLDYVFTFTEADNGKYMTLTCPTINIHNTFTATKEITSLGLRFVGFYSPSATELGTVTIDYIYLGPEETLPSLEQPVYGYDSHYMGDSKFSDGSSLYVEGKGVPNLLYKKDAAGNPIRDANGKLIYTGIDYGNAKDYTETSFTFQGTGFDIISRTGADQGALRIIVLDANGNIYRNNSVLNKSETNLELYQVPVATERDLPYGKYTVKIFANAGYTSTDFPGLNRGNQFFFDAVRIYEPINTAATDADSKLAYSIYQKDGEADTIYKEIRQFLIDQKKYSAGTMEGAVYLDNGETKVAIGRYQEVGPNNEVYLSKGQAIAFMLEATGTLPASVDIGAKSANGEPVNLTISISSTAPGSKPLPEQRTLDSSTIQFYPICVLPSHWTGSSGTKTAYVTVYNHGDGILSLTDIKYAYDTNKGGSTARSLRFLVNDEMLNDMNVCTEHELGKPVDQGDGSHSSTCAVCGAEVIASHSFDGGSCICGAVCSHASTEKRNATEANCIAAGYSGDIFCLDCGITVKSGEVIPALGHRYNDGEITAEPSCTEGGVKTLTCSICGNTSTEVIPATGHVNTSVNTTDATCTEAGSVVVTCVCGEVVSTEVVAPTGHKYEIVNVPATCTERGYDFYFCSCGDSYTANEVPASGHSYGEGEITTVPSCTEDGIKIFTCSVCGNSKTAVIPATGHVNTSVNSTDATCTEAGSVVVTCACGEVVSAETVAPLGHNYGTPVDNGDGTHTATCFCSDAITNEHNFVEGLCICGAVEITEPVVDSSLTFGAQLYLENDLTMAFRVKTDKLNTYDISTAYLVVERDIYETGAKDATVEAMTISDYKIENGRLIFSYPGIAAAQMNDAIRATLYIKDANGKEYVSPVLNTSVATYLDGLLSASASDSKMLTLIMDMLNYGAAAQVYFDRHADAPVNEAFESFRTYASYASADFTKVLENLATSEGTDGKAGKLNIGLDLGTRIGIQYKVTVPADVNVEDVTLVVTDASGNVLENLAVAGNATDSKGRYLVNFYGFTSRDMRRVVYATAYANGEAITGTYAYSISTYAWGVQENASLQPAELVSVTRAMMLYGDSATAYFG